ncbi:Acetyl-/propionyl-coenzyme A carboxylase alpha chain (Includes: Biotin carboxylase; Biotin carboxyl carrier protein) [Thiomonas sp. X19]|uniref:acetyl/propionyl/methylcrotonyl-CoA carboxylase subunit alpha n=1 Tax=Thiomonas sp. X19 TaxID=1050370 RepID=UPI000B6E9F70|nr:biotin carboxylase N-terminal domain-containing protein [Thiomonas sp. X19]SCC92084.1 Acetyl-/propionyl-coenzyme A carboxylase alpha chain (Includes: Biotin carboxylase; Biotin carboxyl carrier protein) [Thiomonas sp. X19]
MFSKVLIANRGEIACRVAATCRELGIRTVAVYSEADAQGAHVAACDEAICIGPAPAAQSYLDAARILQAARDSGAQAVHPGYGFLSENAAFAQACADAGVVFIGPPPAAIHAMGLKAESKRLMQAAGVPLVPGYHGAAQDDALLAAEAARIGYPVLIKASAGGGGKGMREVMAAADFAAALGSCRREAKAAFGNDAVLIEKLVAKPRHIEIQVFADSHGHTVALFERDCSLQRRHQKVVEEAPAPGLTPEQRAALAQAAVAAAQAVGYVGAGTVEFIAEGDGAGGIRSFYFMEMNTRLQVEHPVTEMITGLDLVAWQLRVAAGEPLPAAPQMPHGHAVEVRLYAENPAAGFLPSTGRLARLALPPHVAFKVDGDPAALRVDSGVREGDTITPHYDPMIAKLIAWGETRAQALARMAQGLRAVRIVGPDTNAAFLHRLVQSPAFMAGHMDTGLIAREQGTLLAEALAPEHAALAATCALLEAERAQRTLDPWSACDGWSNGVLPARELHWQRGTHALPASLMRGAEGGWRLALAASQPQPLHWHAAPSGPNELALSIRWGEQTLRAHVVRQDDNRDDSRNDSRAAKPARLHVFASDGHAALSLRQASTHAASGAGGNGRLSAPMPGRIAAVLVAPGQTVQTGQPLLVLEAMKMEHTLQASDGGVIDAVLVAVGEQIQEGALLLRMRAAEASEQDAAGVTTTGDAA